jgi:hypothetical protein
MSYRKIALILAMLAAAGIRVSVARADVRTRKHS